MRKRLHSLLILFIFASVSEHGHAQGYLVSRTPGFYQPLGQTPIDAQAAPHALPRDLARSRGTNAPRTTLPTPLNETIRGSNNEIIGRYDQDGRIYDRRGSMIGRVTNGLISSERGAFEGRISKSGEIYDARGGLVARATRSNLSSPSGRILGHMGTDGRVSDGRVSDGRGAWVGRVPESDPLAAYLLFKGRFEDKPIRK